MSRRELDRMLERAVAEAVGVPYQERAMRRPGRAKVHAAGQPMQRQHSGRELQHA